MKRNIIITVCTLILSLIGTLNASQIIDQKEVGLNTLVEKESTELFDVNEDTVAYQNEEKNSVEETVVTNTNVVETTSEEVGAVPQEKNTKLQISKEDKKENKVEENNSNINKTVVDKTTNNNPVIKKEAVAVEETIKTAKVEKTEIINNNKDKVTQLADNAGLSKITEEITKVAGSSKVRTNGNVQIITNQGNIDLSQCKSVDDIVAVLNQNGMGNVNRSNIQNVIPMDQIRTILQNNGNRTTNPERQQAPVTNVAPTQNKTTTTQNNKNTTTTNKTNTNTNTTTNKPAATPSATPAPAQSTNTGISNYANQVLQLVNQERAKEGLKPLTSTPELQAAATKRAQETVQSFSHTRPNGTQWSTVLKEYNVPNMRSGENIAMGQRTPQEVVTAWMNSPGHRANIMNGSFGRLGVGVYESNGRLYWAQLFTN